MQFINSIVLAALCTAAAVSGAVTRRQAPCDISSNVNCQVAASIWAQAIANPQDDYAYQQALCTGGQDDLTWDQALMACSVCVEEAAALPVGALQFDVIQALYGNHDIEVGSSGGFCNAAYEPGTYGTSGFDQLVETGSNMTSEYGLTILYFSMTEISH